MRRFELTPTQAAAIETNRGLLPPGKCENCGRQAPLYQFYNEYTNEEVIEFKLCPNCIRNAVRCVEMCWRLMPDE